MLVAKEGPFQSLEFSFKYKKNTKDVKILA